MDNIVSMLTTTDGRIGRQQWWIGVAVLSVLGLAAGLALSSFAQAIPFVGRAWLNLLLGLIWIWPVYCIGIKRRQDRDSAGTDLKIFLAGGVILQVSKVLVTGPFLPGDMWSAPVLLFHAANLVWSLFSVYLLVQLGFLEGNRKRNTYGPDPLGVVPGEKPAAS